MAKSKKTPTRHPARERVVGMVLLFINMAVVACALSVFISIDPSPSRVEDLSWGYLDDHIFPANDTEYQVWCANWFTQTQCSGPVKMSGYFSLRTAYIWYRSWDQFNGNYSLGPVVYNVRYSSSADSCILPYTPTSNNVCDECDNKSTIAAVFVMVLLIIQTVVLIDQLRDSSGRVIDESQDHRRKGWYIIVYVVSFVCGIIAYNTMVHGCLEKFPVEYKLGPMPILLLATMLANIIQTLLEVIWLNASKPAKIAPDIKKPSNEKWSKPPSRNTAAPATDPFALTDKQAEAAGHSSANEAAAPNKPNFHDPFADMSPKSNEDEDAGYTDVAPREAPPGSWGPRSPPPFVPAQHGGSPSEAPTVGEASHV